MNTSTEEVPCPPDRLPVTSTIEQMAEDMVARWRDGERPLTEFYLERFPHIQQNSDAVLELIAEELALHEEYGQPISLADFQARFPQWRAQIRALVLCQRTLGRQPPQFPAPGETCGEFELVSELGRGSHARVYLATQPALGNRQVVLKLGPLTGREHLALARLQHTHIVPLYAAHEFPALGLRGLCLPYFGGRSLGDLLALLKDQAVTGNGNDLLAALHDGEALTPGPSPGGRGAGGEGLTSSTPTARTPSPPTPLPEGEGRQTRGTPISEVVCLIGACLADALQYAHERGLLHLDLKPSNVLLAADGTPMLLDFHLARPPLTAGEAAPQWLGGTPGFMAPEQAEALEAVRAGTAIPRDLDARTDVFSLGVVLKKTLAACSRGQAGATSVGLADILSRATASRPEDRYPTAAALAEDLRRHLANQPLRGVANRSLGERWRKWRRRRPHGLPIALALAALAVSISGFSLHSLRLADRAATAHQDGLALMNRGSYAEAVDAFRGGERLAAGLPFQAGLRAQLGEAKRTAERGLAADELHRACEQIRPLYVAEFATRAQLQHVEQRCRELWDKREALATRLAGQATPEMESRWRSDLLDVAILVGRMREQLALPAALRDAHREAMAALDQAEQLLGGSGILYLERARLARELALYAVAEQALAEARTRPPESAWEHLVVGRHHLAAGDVRRALGEFDRCLESDPRSLWGHYYKGVCGLRSGRAVEAVAEFSACTALAPGTAWCLHNLAQAYTDAGELELAYTYFNRALALDPTLAASFLGRAAIHQKKGRYADALADLRTAEDAGIQVAEVEYRKAAVNVAMGDRAAALASLRKCLELEPRHLKAQDLMVRVQVKREGE